MGEKAVLGPTKSRMGMTVMLQREEKLLSSNCEAGLHRELTAPVATCPPPPSLMPAQSQEWRPVSYLVTWLCPRPKGEMQIHRALGADL